MNSRTVGCAVVALLLCAGKPASAATRCVNPGGGSGCFSTVSAAVAAAGPGDTILVSPGTYMEDVLVTKPLSLVGQNRDTTIIDATGQPNGIYIDGFDNSGLADVSVTGFTVKNAQTEGIFVSNASNVRLVHNKVMDNDQALGSTGCTVFVPPDNPAGEGLDCGEGIHLSAVDHSIISDDIVHGNSGGILVSDDSGPTHDNDIRGNRVYGNPFDCGITLASHNPMAPNGVFNNAIVDNQVSSNGLMSGEGAGVGMFTPAPGTATYGNVVTGNTITHNSLPGVAMHSHAPGQNLNDNKIIGNYIAGNGVDTGDAATPGKTGINVFGVTPIMGTIIEGNVIEREDVAIAVKTSSRVDAHYNNLLNHRVGLANLGSGTVDATLNWWGCARGPQASSCSTVSGPDVTVFPWLTHPVPAK